MGLLHPFCLFHVLFLFVTNSMTSGSLYFTDPKEVCSCPLLARSGDWCSNYILTPVNGHVLL